MRNNSEGLVLESIRLVSPASCVAFLARIYLPLSGTHKLSARSIALRRACAVPAAVIALLQHHHLPLLLTIECYVLCTLYSNPSFTCFLPPTRSQQTDAQLRPRTVTTPIPQLASESSPSKTTLQTKSVDRCWIGQNKEKIWILSGSHIRIP